MSPRIFLKIRHICDENIHMRHAENIENLFRVRHTEYVRKSHFKGRLLCHCLYQDFVKILHGFFLQQHSLLLQLKSLLSIVCNYSFISCGMDWCKSSQLKILSMKVNGDGRFELRTSHQVFWRHLSYRFARFTTFRNNFLLV